MIREEGALGTVLGNRVEEGCETLKARQRSLSLMS